MPTEEKRFGQPQDLFERFVVTPGSPYCHQEAVAGLSTNQAEVSQPPIQLVDPGIALYQLAIHASASDQVLKKGCK